MNRSIIRYILGSVLKVEAAFMLLPCIVALCYMEKEGVVYLGVGIVTFLLGMLMTHKKANSSVFYLKEGCVATALSWIFMSFFGCIPFILTGEIPSLIDALFETVSGFTTTGASILSDVEVLSHCTLMWRSFTHWLGGMGVLVFLLAIIPLGGGSRINLMRAESPGPSVGKLVPKVKHTAQILYIIYITLTVVQIIFLCIGKMPLFDSLATAFGTAGTGGFGIKNDSAASYSTYIQWVLTIFMILFGVNFNAYYYILYKQFKKAFKMEEVRYYFLIIIAAVGIIFCHIIDTTKSFFEALTQASFQVDFNKWSQTCKTVLVFLMFCGACAGSTGGGIKVSRFIILIKTIIKDLESYIHPKCIRKIQIDKKPVEHEVVRSVNVFFITFFILFAASVFVLSFEDKDLITNFTAVAATMNNIGPGLALVGPTCNFGHFNVLSKLVLIFDMLAGRLELFPLLILFHPAIWKEMFKIKHHAKCVRD